MAPGTADTSITPGYEVPRNCQFNVFVDNRVGKLLQLMDIFQGQALTLAGMSVIDAADHAVVRLLTSSSVLARRLLQRHELSFTESDVLIIELPDTSTLARITHELRQAELSIAYVYSLHVQPRNHPTLALHIDDQVLASQILRRKNFTLLCENDLGDNRTGSDPAAPSSE